MNVYYRYIYNTNNSLDNVSKLRRVHFDGVCIEFTKYFYHLVRIWIRYFRQRLYYNIVHGVLVIAYSVNQHCYCICKMKLYMFFFFTPRSRTSKQIRSLIKIPLRDSVFGEAILIYSHVLEIISLLKKFATCICFSCFRQRQSAKLLTKTWHSCAVIASQWHLVFNVASYWLNILLKIEKYLVFICGIT